MAAFSKDLKLLTPFLIFVLAANLLAQSQTRHPGIVLFEQAKFADAVRSLEIASKSKEHKADAEIWNYLGLAYMATDAWKKGRSAFEKSVKLNPSNSIFRANAAYAYAITGQIKKAGPAADKAIELDPKNGGAYEVRGRLNLWQQKLDLAERDADLAIKFEPQNVQAYFLKADVVLAEFGERLKAGSTARQEIAFLKEAVDVLETGVRNNPKNVRLSELKNELESITVFYHHFTRNPVEPSSAAAPPEPGVTPLKILVQPRATYTNAARKAGVEGAVRLIILLSADGSVRHVLKLWGIGYGLDESAIRAAKAIKFEPKMRDGKPVPVVITREYTFSIY